jgi:hypothetical protein
MSLIWTPVPGYLLNGERVGEMWITRDNGKWLLIEKVGPTTFEVSYQDRAGSVQFPTLEAAKEAVEREDRS